MSRAGWRHAVGQDRLHYGSHEPARLSAEDAQSDGAGLGVRHKLPGRSAVSVSVQVYHHRSHHELGRENYEETVQESALVVTADVRNDSGNNAGYCTKARQRQETCFVRCLELMWVSLFLRGYCKSDRESKSVVILPLSLAVASRILCILEQGLIETQPQTICNSQIKPISVRKSCSIQIF